MRNTFNGLLYGLAVILAAGGLGGCIVSQQVFLEEASITAPITRPPVFFAPDSSETVQLVGHFAFARPSTMNGKITEHVSSAPGVDNLHWKVPEFTGGIAADIRISEHLSWTAGLDYSSTSALGLVGGVSGLAFHNVKENLGIWFGFGVMLHPISYDSRLLVVTTTNVWDRQSVDSSFFHDRGESSAFDFYIGLTVETRFSRFPVNGFLNLMLARETILSHGVSQYDELHPSSGVHLGADASYRTLVVAASPGLSLRITDQFDLICGVGFHFSTDVEGLFSNPLATPFVQMKMRL